MLYSKLFGKTVRKPPSEATAASHKLLYQAGYIRESAAGRYFFLPLGMKVQQKIMKIIKEEMDNAGAQEMSAPILHPIELWEETNRTDSTGFELMKVTDRRDAEFALGGTAEEMFVDVVRKFRLSYKDLPVNIYQFSTKFRDELRARGGLLRVREFIMKDAYSFHTDENDFRAEYEKMRDTYTRIFKRLGLNTIIVESDNGYIGGEYCHEFIVESEAGESKFLVTEDNSYAAHEDIAKFKRENINTEEPEMPLRIIDQPEWVKTMDDNVKHYKLPKSRFLKNVVYKNRNTKEIIIAAIRGDLEVNKTKLEHAIHAEGELEDASDQDLENIGTKTGYVHSWGHDKARYIGDHSLTTVKNFIGGQKSETKDSVNVNYGRDFSCDLLADIAMAKDGHLSENGKPLFERKGIEVGNIFQLGFHYSEKMKDATYTDKDGKSKPYYMGCYGIGIGRTMAAVVEIHHDEKGIIWPEGISPSDVHLISIGSEPEVLEKAANVYETLKKHNIDVLYDNRTDASAGQKFTDADLIGIPVRLVVSGNTGDQIEYKERINKEKCLLYLNELLVKIKN